MRKELVFPLLLVSMIVMYFKVDFLLLLSLFLSSVVAVLVFRRLKKPFRYVGYSVTYSFIVCSFFLGAQMILDKWL